MTEPPILFYFGTFHLCARAGMCAARRCPPLSSGVPCPHLCTNGVCPLLSPLLPPLTNGQRCKLSVYRPQLQPIYEGATNNGIICGGYHFAHLDTSSGVAQANCFLAHRSRWSGDGIILPGVIDLKVPFFPLACVLTVSDDGMKTTVTQQR